MRRMSLHNQYLDLSDLRRRARARLPKFVWEFLDSGTGAEQTKAANRSALDAIKLRPSILHGEVTPDLATSFLGSTYALPVGIAPVGMSGLIWPQAEHHLSTAANALNLPYCLSTVASETPEAIGKNLNGNGWFQLYPPRDPQIRRDMLQRAKDSGFSTLVLTADVPTASRRERQTRSGLTQPPKLTPRLLAQIATCPAWALGMARHGMPHMRTLDPYVAEAQKGMSPTAHVGYLLRTAPDWTYLKWLRDNWDGPLIVKGVMNSGDATRLQAEGVDAIWVSNHAGRQLDAAPPTIEVLPDIRAATQLPIIFDSGAEGGLDILRAFALGADFVMMGRAWHIALAALGPQGILHFAEILAKDLAANLPQLGVASPSDMSLAQLF
ncbi:MAG: alpha-hydroxy acid oxidase [Paracoccaceae bacterium]|nr:alpha-hydroxy acid oxidase [Paracoccaceae bacterium]MDG1739046.1 alpha-hydroxy acid oxidase [Paracoccaceae bacterium]MDG2257280.1 alpha-hydroxy acid oxidase [Paracoccaceae bacterium]